MMYGYLTENTKSELKCGNLTFMASFFADRVLVPVNNSTTRVCNRIDYPISVCRRHTLLQHMVDLYIQHGGGNDCRQNDVTGIPRLHSFRATFAVILASWSQSTNASCVINYYAGANIWIINIHLNVEISSLYCTCQTSDKLLSVISARLQLRSFRWEPE